MRKVLLASTIALLGFTSTAHAHFVLMAPAPSKPTDASGGKGPPPCGPDATAAATPTPAMGGHTIHLAIKETTFHPGWYRIALGINGRADLPPDPAVYDSKMMLLDPAKATGTSATSDKQLPAKFPVLAGDVWDHTTATAMFEMDLPLPNFDCPKCTLQIEEFMAQHPSNVGIGGFYYHHCADLNITADHTMPIVNPAGGGADGGASGSGGGNAGSGGGAAGAGAGGSTGTAGAGAAGAAGGSTGAAGSSTSGTAGATATAGSNGAAGSGSTGAAGMTTGTGTAGTTGAAGSQPPHQASGGCVVAGSDAGSATALLVLFAAIVIVAARRRHRA